MSRVSREDVYESVSSEREYQVRKWGVDHDENESVGNFLIYLERHLQLAKDAYIDSMYESQALEHVRKVAALAVACMEQHGAPRRF